MIYGYSRISDSSQSLTAQSEQLNEYGVDELVEEVVNGHFQKKDKLDEIVDKMVEGDSLVIARHDRLGRNTLQLLTLIEKIEAKNAKIEILNIGLDSSTVFYKPIIAILSAFSEMERAQLKEKQKIGIASARRRGVHLGRKSKYTKEALEEAVARYRAGGITYADIEQIYGIPKSSLYLALKNT